MRTVSPLVSSHLVQAFIPCVVDSRLLARLDGIELLLGRPLPLGTYHGIVGGESWGGSFAS